MRMALIDILLSIFPLPESLGYARVVLAELEETKLPRFDPQLMSRLALASALEETSLRSNRSEILQALDNGSTVQIAIVSADAAVIMSRVSVWEH